VCPRRVRAWLLVIAIVFGAVAALCLSGCTWGDVPRDADAGISGADTGRDASLPPGKILKIDVQPSSTTLSLGSTVDFKAIATMDTGSALDVTSVVTWTSNNPSVASVDASS
jgi:hypothetical protein